MEQLLDKLGPVLGIVAFLAVNFCLVAIFVFLTVRQSRANRQAWQQIADRTGLSFKPGAFLMMPSVSGEFRRRSLGLTTFTRSSGRSSTTYTRVTLALRSASSGTLALSPEGFLSGLGKTLGMQDVQIGSERFDKSFMIKSNPPELAQAVLTDPMLQDALIRLRERHGSFDIQVSGQSLTYTVMNFMRDTDFLEMAFNTLSDLADKLDGGSKSSVF